MNWKTSLIIASIGTIFITCVMIPAASAEETVLPELTLVDAITLAMEQSPNLKNVDESIRQAEILIGQARSILLPSLQAYGAMTRYDKEIALEFPAEGEPGAEEDPTSVIMQEEWSENYGVTANITLFNARSIPLLKYAHRNVDYAVRSGNHTRNYYLLAVSAAYFQVVSSEELLEVSRENLKTAREFHRLSKARKEVGQATRIDVLRAESQLLDAENTLANAGDGVQLTRSALVKLINGPDAFMVTRPDVGIAAGKTLDEITVYALAHRDDLRAAEIAVEMADQLQRDVYAQWIPAFDLTYNWNWNSASGFAGDNDAWNVRIGANWSLFEGGFRMSDLAKKKSDYRVAQNRLEQFRRDVRQEVNNRYLEVKMRQRRLDLAKQQVDVAHETHRLVNRQYEQGMATSLDLMDATTKLTNARITRVVDDLSLQIATMQLNQATGVYLVYPEED